MTDAVVFDNVSIVFGDKPESALPMMDAGKTRADIQQETQQILGVHNCSLTVQEGEILVLMGLSGSGKSTLLRAVNGLNPVVRGAVHVNVGDWSCDPSNCSKDDLLRLRRRSVAMVFQQFGLLPWRNVTDNVALGLELGGMSRAKREAKVKEQLELVGLSDWADSKVSELSGGMQQRVGLARAFATDAPILLMDEPFSALDPLIRTRLQDELLELQAKLKRTIIFVSHDLDEAFKLGNRIAIMDGGRIIQCGTPQEITANPANGYVEDFVTHMNPLRVLQASDVMLTDDPGTPSTPDNDVQVEMGAPVADVIDALSSGADTIGVTDEDGKEVGSISSQQIVDALQSKTSKDAE
ncbi:MULTISPECIES: choline ABC transporter ATP-binding protein [Devosia]|jgi:glycine betaine/proline transport system ATP-binding protein|uniref:Trimethylamine N-oxide transport system ATP-binding protein TmoW n=1 Tax=Devosia litorisediminis TaxID=2829817 RepID=A0A942E4F7_9HYPH|nr:MULTISPECIES: choline ABC transporter ATP-binding protein [Devosia]MBS3847256.1 choline ABC transporter ATP-binding protein [Devosia litorisediminis]MCZ4346628.1 choline ABC transporter ATP-binding protein [Devosia neptuniae]|tara:strand:+ start:5259 stop:6317 length:1059 start_codon:yes stop_codon:yes gene_type:complete